MTYPSGREIYYIYEAPPVGRLLSQSENAGGTQNLVEYTYLGMNTIVKETHPQVSGGLTLSYGSNGTYAGWDRFGRIASQEWRKSDGTLVDGYSYTYDRAGNRTSKGNLLNSACSETYSYDGLNRLVDANRNGANLQDWGLDALGNWSNTTIGSTSQSRTNNSANEITDIGGTGGWVDPAYDAAGNMTLIPKAGAESSGYEATYDAWNHLVEVYLGAMDGAYYQYDGLGRLVFVAKNYGGANYNYYYNENNQVIEVRSYDLDMSTSVVDQYVWSQRYIDAPVARFSEWKLIGFPDPPTLSMYYYTDDTNFDVTGQVNAATGGFTGRAVYTPYGARTVLTATWTTGGYIGSLGHQGLFLLEGTGTGMYYNRARFYHPTLGIFTQRDPMGYVDGGSLYQYEKSGPVIHADPSGMQQFGFGGGPLDPNPGFPPGWPRDVNGQPVDFPLPPHPFEPRWKSERFTSPWARAELYTTRCPASPAVRMGAWWSGVAGGGFIGGSRIAVIGGGIAVIGEVWGAWEFGLAIGSMCHCLEPVPA